MRGRKDDLPDVKRIFHIYENIIYLDNKYY